MIDRPGLFIPVVGPSGAGKDTLIAAVRERLAGDPRFVFVRRTVTRAEGGNEDHETVHAADFEALRKAGAYVLTWGAHGLSYGIPASALSAVRAGRVVVANMSRGALAEARITFPAVRTIQVTAPPAVLAVRLAQRGRETIAEIETRLARAGGADCSGPDDVIVIDNSGPLPVAVDRFASLLTTFAGRL